MRVVKPPLPFDMMCKINLAIAQSEEARSMNARENIPKGNYFIHHDTLYIAISPIAKGMEIKPGINCVAKSINDLNGGNQS